MFCASLEKYVFYTNLKGQSFWAFLDIEILVSSYLLSEIENLSFCSSWLWGSLVLFGRVCGWVGLFALYLLTFFLNLFFDIVTMTCYLESHLWLCHFAILHALNFFLKKSTYFLCLFYKFANSTQIQQHFWTCKKKSNVKQYWR